MRFPCTNASFRQWISSTFGHPQQYSIPAHHGIQVHKVFKYHATDMRRSRLCPTPPESQNRWLEIDLPGYGNGVGVLHIMAAGSSAQSPATAAKTRFWDAVLQAAEARLHEPFLFVGDWNTGAHRVNEVGKTFICAQHFAQLSAMGWMDLWRHHNPGFTSTPGSRSLRAVRGGMGSEWIMRSPRRVFGPASRHAGIRTRSGTRE
jgi:exonuclease III